MMLQTHTHTCNTYIHTYIDEVDQGSSGALGTQICTHTHTCNTCIHIDEVDQGASCTAGGLWE
jgi:hypothetical protein